MNARSFSLSSSGSLYGLVLVLLGACGGGGGDDDFDFDVRSSLVSTSAAGPVAISGRYIAFAASEGTTGTSGLPPTPGTNFNEANGDTDRTDSIAVVIDGVDRTETVLNVAVALPPDVSQPFAWIGNELYIAVDEARDNKDWDLDTMMDDLVLLHWSEAMPVLTLVDTLAPAVVTSMSQPMIAVGTALFYSAAVDPLDPPLGPMESNLKRISSSAPLTVVPIATQDTLGPLAPRILSEDEGLIFLTLDENLELRNLNDDTDVVPNDFYVLALLDGTIAAPILRSTKLALLEDQGPFRARKTATSDWQVGFLVSESAQGKNLNDPFSSEFDLNWKPIQCDGYEDSDMDDTVLHYLAFKNWNIDPTLSKIRNTGLVGSRKIAIANGFIATVTRESDEGTPPCDLNQDGTFDDDIVRWTEIVPDPVAILPANSSANLRALADIAGPTGGLAELSNRFVIVVSEAKDGQDINNDTLLDEDLLGWLLPTTVTTAWDFTHTNGSFVGTTWMAEQHDRGRLFVALEEHVNDVNLNTSTPPLPGEDTDKDDSIPTFASFSGSTIVFPGVKVAVDKDDAGITVAQSNGYYRVSEAEDSRDWNSDNDETDFVLFVTSLEQGISKRLGTMDETVLPGSRPAIAFNPAETPVVAAFVLQEQSVGAGGTDVNQDGDAGDIVLQYFRL